MTNKKIEYLYDVFIFQEYKNSFFDVIFHVDGKLYAHGQILSFASDVFKKQILKNRANGNGPIQINDYTYDEFFEFLRLIYLPDDNFDPDKDMIRAVIELADIYEADEIKQEVGMVLADGGGFEASENGVLTNTDINDIFEKIEMAQKYSLDSFKKFYRIDAFFQNHLSTLLFFKFRGFIDLDKNVIKAFVAFVFERSLDMVQKMDMFYSVYKWGEHQAMITVEMPEDEKKKLVLHQIKDILPLFDCQTLLLFFVRQINLISIDEANEYKTIKVCITCNDNTITGTFLDDYGIFEWIKSHKNTRLDDSYETGRRTFWSKVFKIPLYPSKLKKTESINWYLAFGINGKLNLKHESKIEENDYLIAEMKASNENESNDEFIDVEEDGNDEEEKYDDEDDDHEMSSGEEDEEDESFFTIERYDRVYATVSRQF